VSAAPWDTTSQGVGKERRPTHKVQRAGTRVAAPELVLKVLATKQKVSPHAEDGRTVGEGVVSPMRHNI
jgi:hypothetical protein